MEVTVYKIRRKNFTAEVYSRADAVTLKPDATGRLYIFDDGEGSESLLIIRRLLDTPAEVIAAQANGIYIHTQDTPSSIWTVVHNLGHRADITIFDTDDNQVICDIHHDSDNISTLTFSQLIAGIARAD